MTYNNYVYMYIQGSELVVACVYWSNILGDYQNLKACTCAHVARWSTKYIYSV